MIIETLPLMNQADSENKLKCKSIYYRFKNEKKRHIINLNDNDGGNISILELKKRISNSMHLLKDEAQAKIQETDFHFLIYEEGVDQGCEDSKLIVPGQSVVVEKVPWYKIQKIEEKKNKEKLESFIKLLNCNFCKNTDEKYEFLMTSCCGESGCETCMNLKISNNDGNDKIPHLESLNTSDLTCPFCHIKNNTLTLMPNKRMNQIREYFYSLKKTIFAENNTLSDLNGIDSINTQSNLISSSDPHSMVNLIQINLNPHDQLFEKARFFIIKSHNKENIEISQLHNEWATTIANQKKLNDSFGENYTILIFSANKSGFFQGYAIMKSYISDKVSDLWSNENSIKLGGSFKIEWLCSCELPFTKVKHLTNPLNNNDPIIKSRDTQELTKELGIQICHYLYEQEKIESSVRRNKPIFDNNRLRSSIEEIKTNQTDKKEIIEYFNFKQISSQTFLNANLTKNGQCVSPNTYSHSNPVLCGSLTNSRRSSFDDFRSKIKILIKKTY